MFTKTIDQAKCKKCFECRDICFIKNISEKADGFPSFESEYSCMYCGHCLSICPNTAIIFDQKPTDKNETFKKQVVGPIDLDIKRPPIDEKDLVGFLSSIRSCRKFIDKPIEKEKIDKILDIMTRAPSGGKEQNRSYYDISSKEIIDRLDQQLIDYNLKNLKILQNRIVERFIIYKNASDMKTKWFHNSELLLTSAVAHPGPAGDGRQKSANTI